LIKKTLEKRETGRRGSEGLGTPRGGRADGLKGHGVQVFLISGGWGAKKGTKRKSMGEQKKKNVQR